MVVCNKYLDKEKINVVIDDALLVFFLLKYCDDEKKYMPEVYIKYINFIYTKELDFFLMKYVHFQIQSV